MDPKAPNEMGQNSFHAFAETNAETCGYDSLGDRIRASMVNTMPSPTTSRPSTTFLPRDQLDAIMTPDSVREELRQSAPHIPEMFRAMYTKAICSPIKPRRKIFTILVLIDQVSVISKFMDGEFTDSSLPVKLLDDGTN
ncbi:protein kinase domain-containing protein [Colletotrichum chrysophilum]|uniref:Protein kinase domain-containing protein n=1 Tax=Colletotrichum chrysophilum TaxID=1836956 RepID=A0AAD9A610_9PEZI|nr:protein kinase domain-containing protein [Colletotrichum chrysophilum]